MGVRLSIGIRLGRARQRRRGGALVGIFAILFQTVLFAWHHHPAPFHVRSAGAVTTLAAPTTPAMPALADHECEICFAISHHGAVPVSFLAAKPPEHATLHRSRLVAVETSSALYILFQSRAPPLA
jgi:hypothetical protein